MQKDVLYIDVEDDITAIIGKVKSAQHKIVALVPPKRIGVLQSAVNLRLLNRAAEQQGKRLVLISNNAALASLAAAATIPVAKNLQSKPELAEIAALDVDDGEDIIDGASLPIGEHAKQAGGASEDDAASALGTAAVGATTAEKAKPPTNPADASPKAKRGGVPDFNKFRKKLALIIAGVVLLVGFLIWAIFFAANARIVVATRTTDAAVSQQVTLSTTADTSVRNNIISATTKQVRQEVSASITATGERNVGEKASGTVTLSRNSLSSTSVPAGTELAAASGVVFVTNETVTIPSTSLCGEPPALCPGSVRVGVTAKDRGAESNGASGSLSGAPSGASAAFDGPTSGGTDKTVDVYTNSDIEKAREAALEKLDDAKARQSLTQEFGDQFIVLEDSLQRDVRSIKSSVQVGDEKAATAEFAGEAVFTMYGVSKDELSDYLKAVLEQQIDDTTRQRVYESGAAQAQFTNVDRTDNGLRATLSTNGKIGPSIDENEVKETASGKRIGEIKAAIENINGVESVDVTLSPFWVNTAPDNLDKITVEFQLND